MCSSYHCLFVLLRVFTFCYLKMSPISLASGEIQINSTLRFPSFSQDGQHLENTGQKMLGGCGGRRTFIHCRRWSGNGEYDLVQPPCKSYADFSETSWHSHTAFGSYLHSHAYSQLFYAQQLGKGTSPDVHPQTSARRYVQNKQKKEDMYIDKIFIQP